MANPFDSIVDVPLPTPRPSNPFDSIVDEASEPAVPGAEAVSPPSALPTPVPTSQAVPSGPPSPAPTFTAPNVFDSVVNEPGQTLALPTPSPVPLENRPTTQ